MNPQSQENSQQNSSNNSRINHFQTCQHLQKRHFLNNLMNCYDCGIFLQINEMSYKSQQAKYTASFDPHKCLKAALKKRSPKVEIKADSDYKRERQQLIEFVQDIGEKLKLSQNSIHLSIFYLDTSNTLIKIDSTQLRLFAATCVMLAAKSIELDERIPFISKLRKFSQLSNSTKEFQKCESQIVEAFQWNLQCVTYMDIIQFYIGQGVVCGSDQFEIAKKDRTLTEKKLNLNETFQDSFLLNINETTTLIKNLLDSQILQIVQNLEKESCKLAEALLKDVKFYTYDLEMVSAAAMAYLRKQIGIKNIWNKGLNTLTGYTEDQIKSCFLEIEKSLDENSVKKNILIQQQQYNENSISPTKALENTYPYSYLLRNSNSSSYFGKYQNVLYGNQKVYNQGGDLSNRFSSFSSNNINLFSSNNYNTLNSKLYNIRPQPSYIRYGSQIL